MGLLSPILRDGAGNLLTWWCPGCKSAHQIAHGDGAGLRWGWNGDVARPTFTPSVLVTGSEFTDSGRAAYEAWLAAGFSRPASPRFESRDTCCHSFVVSGRMQFLADCTHALAGQTIDIPPWPRGEG
jgi:Family of unknown function (DUF6527)